MRQPNTGIQGYRAPFVVLPLRGAFAFFLSSGVTNPIARFGGGAGACNSCDIESASSAIWRSCVGHLAFQPLDLPGQFPVARDEATQFHKGTHDVHADLGRAWAAEQ